MVIVLCRDNLKGSMKISIRRYTVIENWTETMKRHNTIEGNVFELQFDHKKFKIHLK